LILPERLDPVSRTDIMAAGVALRRYWVRRRTQWSDRQVVPDPPAEVEMSRSVRGVGEPLESLEARQHLSVSVKVNFQPPAAPVPAGNVADGGATYGLRGNGYSYGWDSANTSYRDRNRLTDQRYDTLIHMKARTWSLGVPNGTYTVRLVAGDPSYYDGVFRLDLEGQPALSGTPTSASRFVESTKTVAVSDGKLTLTSGAGAINNKVAFLEVSPSRSPTAPSSTTPTCTWRPRPSPTPTPATPTARPTGRFGPAVPTRSSGARTA
jgi:hypothetical protein